MGRNNCNAEGYRDPTATKAVGHVARLERMCSSCRHKSYCSTAFKRDHWCGNHQTREGKDHENRSRK